MEPSEPNRYRVKMASGLAFQPEVSVVIMDINGRNLMKLN
jgi:hypothetical protein